ncbi:ATP-binding response regulator [Caldithrix abyssi]|uniref:histidine kinase n=1 Tax=Caldithrix abyssi DSM 13497 TaxID=880073 RepID=H1XSE5_CALAY|nr:hybrid sensor histidine kinase/response regulator [Caldithrix abyssi]APF17222.1 Signal transduction histidine kinase [Caldithrix abyssi DSM 13497]EHO41357.1 response regulator receiver sensor signal transduction histidine kinase [Caldithrix abyssi DSM 13497]
MLEEKIEANNTRTQLNRDFKPNILVIEDEPEVRESYIDMFEFLGYQVDVAENGMAGLEKLKKKAYQIVFTDLNMPVMDGLQTLRLIKKKYPETEVIVITGFATIENAIKAMKQGAFDYITKPVSFEHVRIVLNRCIQNINARRENQKLKDLNHQLRELNEMKNKFITLTNHELRTPLAVLKGYFDLLAMELNENPNSENVQEYLNIIQSTLNEMSEMIENMHDLTLLSNYNSALQKKDFKINNLVLNVYKKMHSLFDLRKIQFSYKLDPNDPVVSIDPQKLERAVGELVQNALKYTPEGGKVLLRVKFDHLKNVVYLSVADTGIGIPHDKLELIFEPFYEVQDEMHHSTSKVQFMGGGIGVGLSIVKEIVEAHNGEVMVESNPGKGSVFTILLKAKT